MVHRIGKSFIFLVRLYKKAFVTALSLYFLAISINIVPNLSLSSIFSLGGWGSPEKHLRVWVLKGTKDLGGGRFGGGHWSFLL